MDNLVRQSTIRSLTRIGAILAAMGVAACGTIDPIRGGSSMRVEVFSYSGPLADQPETQLARLEGLVDQLKVDTRGMQELARATRRAISIPGLDSIERQNALRNALSNAAWTYFDGKKPDSSALPTRVAELQATLTDVVDKALASPSAKALVLLPIAAKSKRLADRHLNPGSNGFSKELVEKFFTDYLSEVTFDPCLHFADATAVASQSVLTLRKAEENSGMLALCLTMTHLTRHLDEIQRIAEATPSPEKTSENEGNQNEILSGMKMIPFTAALIKEMPKPAPNKNKDDGITSTDIDKDGNQTGPATQNGGTQVPQQQSSQPTTVFAAMISKDQNAGLVQYLTYANATAARLRIVAEYWAQALTNGNYPILQLRNVVAIIANFAAQYSDQIHHRSDTLLRMIEMVKQGKNPDDLPLSVKLRNTELSNYLNLYIWRRAFGRALDGDLLSDGIYTSPTEEATDRVRSLEQLYRNDNWEKINQVYASGRGDVSMMMVKDAVGNWDLRSFSTEPGELLAAYRNVGTELLKAAAKAATGTSLPSSLDVDQLREVTDLGSAFAFGGQAPDASGTTTPSGATEDDVALVKLKDQVAVQLRAVKADLEAAETALHPAIEKANQTKDIQAGATFEGAKTENDKAIADKAAGVPIAPNAPTHDERMCIDPKTVKSADNDIPEDTLPKPLALDATARTNLGDACRKWVEAYDGLEDGADYRKMEAENTEKQADNLNKAKLAAVDVLENYRQVIQLYQSTIATE